MTGEESGSGQKPVAVPDPTSVEIASWLLATVAAAPWLSQQLASPARLLHYGGVTVLDSRKRQCVGHLADAARI